MEFSFSVLTPFLNHIFLIYYYWPTIPWLSTTCLIINHIKAIIAKAEEVPIAMTHFLGYLNLLSLLRGEFDWASLLFQGFPAKNKGVRLDFPRKNGHLR